MLVLTKPLGTQIAVNLGTRLSVAQPHILCQVCGVYVSYEWEAGLKSLHIGVEIAFSGPASHSKSSLWCVQVVRM